MQSLLYLAGRISALPDWDKVGGWMKIWRGHAHADTSIAALDAANTLATPHRGLSHTCTTNKHAQCTSGQFFIKRDQGRDQGMAFLRYLVEGRVAHYKGRIRDEAARYMQAYKDVEGVINALYPMAPVRTLACDDCPLSCVGAISTPNK